MNALIAKCSLMTARSAVTMTAVPRMTFAATTKKSTLEKKEVGDEKNYFNKEDEKLLKGLLKKMQNVQKAEETSTADSEKKLTALFKKHNVAADGANAEFFKALLEWKNQP